MRLLVGLLGGLACALISSHSATLNVAIVRMARYNSSTIVQNQSSGQCFETVNHSNNTNDDPVITGEFNWSEKLQGIILGANFYLWLITPSISGRVAERFGSKWLTAAAVMIPAITLVLLPVTARYNVNLMIVLLVVQGLFHGCIFAALFSLYANWFTITERTVAVAGIAAGSNFGNVVAFPIAGYLCEHGFAGGWPSAFYVVSLVHITWIILWLLFVEDTPLKSNTSGIVKCSDEELIFIQSNLRSFGAPQRSSTAPWLKIFTSKCVWATIVNKTAATWLYYLLLAKLPSYLDKVFGVSVVQNGLLNASTSLATGVSMIICGPLSNYIIRKASHKVSKTMVRKIFQTIALIGPAVCLAIITTMGCDSNAVVALMITALFLYGFMSGGEWPVISEFAPDFSGTVFGVCATIAVWPSFVAPIVVGVMLGDNPGERSHWNEVYYITIGVCVLGTLGFILFGSAEPQEWGLFKKDKKHGQTDNDVGNQMH